MELQRCDIINIFRYWCQTNSAAVDIILSDDNTRLIPWIFSGLGHTGVMFKCNGTEFPLSLLKRKSDGRALHATPVTEMFITKFRSIIRDVANSDTPLEILKLQNMFDGTRFESRFYTRLEILQKRGPAVFYRKMSVISTPPKNIFVQTGTADAELITEFAIQTGRQRDNLPTLVRFPEKLLLRLNDISEKTAAVMKTAELASITCEDAAALLFFSDAQLEIFVFPSHIKYN